MQSCFSSLHRGHNGWKCPTLPLITEGWKWNVGGGNAGDMETGISWISQCSQVHLADRHPGPMPCHGVCAMISVCTVCHLQLIQHDEAAVERLLKSYEMMLGFYGIELVDRQTGQVRRAHNWHVRFHNLNRFVLVFTVRRIAKRGLSSRRNICLSLSGNVSNEKNTVKLPRPRCSPILLMRTPNFIKIPTESL